MRSILPLVFVLVFVLLCACAEGRDVFVDNMAGDDTFTGEKPHGVARADRTGPVRSITRGLQLAEQGDRIVLAANKEPYRESISLVGSSNSGHSFLAFVFEGNGAILDGSAPVPTGAWEHYDGPIFRFHPPRLGHQKLFLNDRPAPQVTVSRLAGGPPELEPLQWCLHGGYIYFCVEWGRLPEDYPLTYAEKRTGVTLFHVDNVVISDLTVQGFQLDGINAYNSAREVNIREVKCRGNGRAGIAVGGASLVNLEGCGVGDNGDAQLLTLPWSETHVADSVLISNTAPAVVRQGGRLYVDGQVVSGEPSEIRPAEIP